MNTHLRDNKSTLARTLFAWLDISGLFSYHKMKGGHKARPCRITHTHVCLSLFLIRTHNVSLVLEEEGVDKGNLADGYLNRDVLTTQSYVLVQLYMLCA